MLLTSVLISLALSWGNLQQDIQSGTDETQNENQLERVWVMAGHSTGEKGRFMLSESPDCRYLATAGGQDRTIKIWDNDKHELLKTLCVPNRQVIKSVDFSTDGSMLLVGAMKGIFVFNTKTWQIIHTIPQPVANGCMFIGEDRYILHHGPAEVVYDLQGILPIGRVPVNFDPFFIRDATHMMVPSRDEMIVPAQKNAWQTHMVRINLVTGEQSKLFPCLFEYAPYRIIPAKACIGVIPGERLLFMQLNEGTGQGNLYLTDRDCKEGWMVDGFSFKKMTTSDRIEVIKSVQASLLGIVVPMNDSDQILRYDTGSMKQIGAPIRLDHEGRCKNLALDQEGLLIFDNILYRRNNDSIVSAIYSQLSSEVSSFYDSDASPYQALAAFDGRVRVWNKKQPSEAWSFICPAVMQPGVHARLMSPAILSDIFIWDDKVIGGSAGPFIYVFNMRTGKFAIKHVIDPDSGWQDRPLIRPHKNGGQILVGSALSKKGLRLIDTISGDIVRKYEPSSNVSILASSSKYVTAFTENRVRLWEIETGKLILDMEPPSDSVRQLAINESLKLLITGDARGKIMVFDISSGKQKRECKGHTGCIVSLVATKDNRLISRADDAQDEFPLRVWDMGTGIQKMQVRSEIGPCSAEMPLCNGMAYSDKTGIIYYVRNDATVIAAKLDRSE